MEWILPGRLAGSARPGLLDELADDLRQLQRLGIRLIVNLTETPHQPPVEDWGFASLHFPIPDMGISSPRAVWPLCLQILESIEKNEPVLVHCKAGLGRTGMVLACCLALQGEDAEKAVRRVRNTNSLFIQTPAQEKFVHDFTTFVRATEAGPS